MTVAGGAKQKQRLTPSLALADGKGSHREVSRWLGVKLLAYSQFAHSSWVRIPLINTVNKKATHLTMNCFFV